MRMALNLVLLLAFVGQVPAQSAELVGKVVAVVDGDTVRVLDASNREHKIRLQGIDAPERGQPFGNRSRQHLASLVAGKTVHIDSQKKDRYGRILGKLWVAPEHCDDCDPNLDANLAQIQAGMAWWYYHYADEQLPADRTAYQSAVNAAKNARLGLWQASDPIPPWAWRRGQRAPVASQPGGALSCGQKRYCREMSSCEEAVFYLKNCGVGSLDGDRDGVPCESICR